MSIYDLIGPWSEVKLEIVRDYAKEYSVILSAQTRKIPRFSHVYIDAFAGAGLHVSRTTGEFIAGSPLNALWVEPPFDEYYFIDLDQKKVDQLHEIEAVRPDVFVYEGDCNEILLREVFPRVRYQDYRRGLCLLDPYRLDLDWEVIYAAGQMGTIDMFLNFPLMHMNRNILRHNPDTASTKEIGRMNRFWGDDSWKRIAYQPSRQMSLLEEVVIEKTEPATVVGAFRERLRKVATFSYVPEPIPMRNSKGNVVYYLFFASHKPVAEDIVMHIFDKYRS